MSQDPFPSLSGRIHAVPATGDPLSAPAGEMEHAVFLLRFSERALEEAADLTEEEEVRRRILRTAIRLHDVIETLASKSIDLHRPDNHPLDETSSEIPFRFTRRVERTARLHERAQLAMHQ